MWMYIWMDDHEWMIDWMNGNEMFTEHAFNESKCVIKYFQRNLSCWLGDHRATEGWLAQADPWTTKALHRRRRRIIGTVSVLCVILYIIVLYYHYVLLYMIISCQSSYFQRSNKFGPLQNKWLLKRALSFATFHISNRRLCLRLLLANLPWIFVDLSPNTKAINYSPFGLI